MRKRILYSILAVAFTSIILVATIGMVVLYGNLNNQFWNTLRAETKLVAAGLESNNYEYLYRLAGPDHRITVIKEDGMVEYDSWNNAADMDYHGNRPEVVAARRYAEGESSRYSVTMDETSVYCARLLSDGRVVRLSSTYDDMMGSVFEFIPFLAGVCVFALLMAGLLAMYQTDKIVEPINELNLDAPMEKTAYREITPLLRRIEKQRTRIDRQVRQLEEKKREFTIVTENLQEGLVLLNSLGAVLSLNNSAREILDVDTPDVVEKHILTLNRNPELAHTVRQGLEGERQDVLLELHGRQYRVTAGPVQEAPDCVVEGLVLLFVDVTEIQMAEEMRKEFSANVSHELKTPLTSISGYAEIMKNGLVQPEDVPEFAQRIYGEAERLISLVEDIIRLSRLDDYSDTLEQEPVKLLALAKSVCSRLEPLAERYEISLDASGEEETVMGAPQILEEVIFNLCENAVKYNRVDGSVNVLVGRQGNNAMVEVVDTGIGIPQEQQERVFERFYRADKSHSRVTGGTGLGLSIVKRGVLYHNGEIKMMSEPGKGTTITLLLPLSENTL